MRTLLPRTCVCLFALTGSLVLAQEDLPQWAERELQFQKVDEPILMEGMSVKPGVVRPQWTASFRIDAGKFSEQWEINRRVDDWVLQTRSAEQLSEEQRDLVRNGDVVVDRRGWPRTAGSSDDAAQIRLYAVTEEDARLMARAVIEWLERSPRSNFEQRQSWLIDGIARLAKERRKLDDFLREHPNPSERLEEVKKTVWYKSIEEAQEDMRVLEKAMRAVGVDVAGITAKTASIRKYLENGAVTRRPGVEDVLHQLLIQQDIEMAGAIARKAALEGHLQRAREYLRAVEVNKEYDKSVRSIHRREEGIESAREKLRNPEQGFRPLEVRGPVTIQPIKYPDE